MKDSLMMMVGAAAGIGLYIGLSNLTSNKKDLKKKMNNIIDDTASMFNN